MSIVERLFWALVIAILANILLRHGGDWREAKEEAGDWFGRGRDFVAPRAQSAWETIKGHKLVTIVFVVVFIWLANTWLQPPPPEVVQLQWGVNSLEDRCGNMVELWVLQYGDPSDPTRLEVILPNDIGRAIRILGAGADPTECEQLFPIQGE